MYPFSIYLEHEMRTKSIIALATSLSLIGCGASSEEGTTETTTTGSITTTTATTPAGFDIVGTAANLLTGMPAEEGLCIHASDPTAAITGGEIEILASAVIGKNGSYLVENVSTTSMLGILMLVEDCDQTGSEMPTATGIALSSYSGLGEGDELSGIVSFTIDADSLSFVSASLAAEGYTGDLTEDGALVGFVLDAQGVPVDDAVVTGHKDFPVYYLSETGFDGTSTSVLANSLFAVPAAPIFTYECEAEGYVFDSILAGSQTGYAVVIAFDAI